MLSRQAAKRQVKGQRGQGSGPAPACAPEPEFEDEDDDEDERCQDWEVPVTFSNWRVK